MPRIGRIAIALVALVPIAGWSCPPALADSDTSTISASIVPGELTATLPSFALPTVTASTTAQSTSADSAMTITDATLANDGWAVTMNATNLTSAGANQITADHLTASFGSAVTLAGDGSPTIVVEGTPLPLNSPVIAVMAPEDRSAGEFEVPVSLALTVPAATPPGEYLGTVTTTIGTPPR